MATKKFEERLRAHADQFHPVVPFEKNDTLLLLDFTENNKELNAETLEDTNQFIQYINFKLEKAGAKYGIGGYDEHRTIYSRSKVFDGEQPPLTWLPDRQASPMGKNYSQPSLNQDANNLSASSSSKVSASDFPPPGKPKGAGIGMGAEPRRLHLGIDIWGKPYTKVMAPLDGIVHSFAFNNAFGDYGATIVLTHNSDGESFHTLYGHLSLNSIKNIQEGDRIKKGDVFAGFGIPFENGQWPPHLHFQLIIDMEGMKGDYPGVCRFSEREKYLSNCPDADLILQMMQYAVVK